MDIDHLLDYKNFYSKYLKNIKSSGDQLSARCPFHDEKNNSFSVNLKTGQWSCFTEGIHGNIYDFYAKINNLSTEMAKEQLYSELGIERDAKKEKEKKGPILSNYSLEQYATEKHIQREYLAQFWGLSECQRRKVQTVKIPYFDQNGQIVATRYRHAKTDDPRFEWEKGSNTGTLYGLQTLESIKEDKYAIICEGESDAQTLAWLGFNALGAPGASTINTKQIAPLADIEGLKIYLHVEPDNGGATFLRKAKEAFRELEFKGDLYVFRCSDKGAKDPSELYINNADQSSDIISELMQHAERVNLEEMPQIPETIKGAPINLRAPDGFLIDDNGIYTYNKEGEINLVTSTPFTISKRINSLESNQQKIELYIKKDNSRICEIFNRKDIFINNNILATLSEKGVNISSANVKSLVKYITKLEQINGDLIPDVEYVTRNGWIDNQRFMPYKNENVIIDDTCNEDRNGTIFKIKGDLQKWCSVMQPHRSRAIFRFILASSFAAPLIRLVKCRSILVYNWANSRGGKTAALKAALSVWGNADKMMISFNSTVTALERTANFYNDLPIGIDERQSTVNSQKMLETLFFMISTGKSKSRSNAKLGLQKVDNWMTCALFTGEQPFIDANSDDGISSRLFEIYGKPFHDETQASQMHRDLSEFAGVAGQKFINDLIKTEREKIQELNNIYIEQIEGFDLGLDDSHIRMLACVGLADTLASVFVFSESWDQAHSESMQMMRKIAESVKNSSLPDKNLRACSHLYDFYMANREIYFNEDNKIKGFYGYERANGMKIKSNIGGYASNENEQKADQLIIFKAYFEKMIEDFGFNAGKVKMFLIENNLIETSKSQTGRKDLKVIKYNGATIRPYIINLNKLRALLFPDNMQDAAITERVPQVNSYC